MIDGFKKLTIETKEEYNKYLYETDGFIPSSYYFCEALVWDFAFTKYYRVVEGYFCILVHIKALDKLAFIPPTGKYNKESFQRVVKLLYCEMKKRNEALIFYEVTELMKKRINQISDLKKDIFYSRPSSEYLYKREEFLNTFQKQSVRYAYNHFIRNHEIKVHTINEDNVYNIYHITKFYCENKNCKDCRMGCEVTVTENIIKHYKELDLKGFLLEVDGEMAAFAIYEKLNHDICFHFKKHKLGIRGINEYIHKLMLDYYDNDNEIEWINYTDDMNITGLRKYKSSLCNYILRDIYEITITV